MKRLITTILALVMFGMGGLNQACAHPMGNFSISHYARFNAESKRLRILYLLDFAEIPTLEEINRDVNDRVDPEEKDAFLKEMAPKIFQRLHFRVDGKPLSPKILKQTVSVRTKAAGLSTVLFRLEMEWQYPKHTDATRFRVEFEDKNYEERAGWREIVAVGEGANLFESNVPTQDITNELHAYLSSPDAPPLQVTQATLVIGFGTGPPRPLPHVVQTPPSQSTSSLNTPQNAFTQAIALPELKPMAMLAALLLAFGFGAAHALSPGHGKAMVASYLVGVRGTPKHALVLGAVITLTHTLGVFLLGLVALFASKYVLPERLYPILSLASGATVLLVGLGLFWSRLRALHAPKRTREAEEEDESPDIPPDADLSWKTLVVLGMTGGALPCPSALVVMLSAIALGRIAFGFALIVAFSFGLAVVLSGIGLLAISARGWMGRFQSHRRLFTHLPLLSAGAVIVIGIVLLFQALRG